MSLSYFEVHVYTPGYLPEGDPGEVKTLEDAREWLVEELGTTRGESDDSGDEAAFQAAVEAAKKAEVDEVIHFGGYAHSIAFIQ